MYVYQITNQVNGKAYIGITNNYQRRWANHKCNNDPTMIIAKAIKKYGVENFTFEVLFSDLTIPEAEKKEIELIQSKQTLTPNGYNVAKGGLYNIENTARLGADNGKALLTEEEVIYIREHRDQPEYLLYDEFSDKISYESFKKVYLGKTYTNIKCKEVPIYPFNMQFSNQFSKSKLTYEEVVDLRNKYNEGIYWKDLYLEKYQDIFTNEWSFWNVYNGKSYKLVMPEVFTEENKRKHASLARKGERNGRSKLTIEDVKTIRRLHSEGVSNGDLYKQFSQVSTTSIRDIINRKTWKNI